ncbi:hypothetical protein RRG08_021921 [Elysia crispata]|uniref:Uncharacterized protein n=1 Tax=Elysia crispata TaxID=231223 RepID=A0AAE1AD92_9GAST|nr:hypothetical protein RRG08_021921 [Elysia crispata]
MVRSLLMKYFKRMDRAKLGLSDSTRIRHRPKVLPPDITICTAILATCIISQGATSRLPSVLRSKEQSSNHEVLPEDNHLYCALKNRPEIPRSPSVLRSKEPAFYPELPPKDHHLYCALRNRPRISRCYHQITICTALCGIDLTSRGNCIISRAAITRSPSVLRSKEPTSDHEVIPPEHHLHCAFRNLPEIRGKGLGSRDATTRSPSALCSKEQASDPEVLPQDHPLHCALRNRLHIPRCYHQRTICTALLGICLRFEVLPPDITICTAIFGTCIISPGAIIISPSALHSKEPPSYPEVVPQITICIVL